MCFLNREGFCRQAPEVQGRWKDYGVYAAPKREGERGGEIFCLFALVSTDESSSEVWFCTALPVKHHHGITNLTVIPKLSKPHCTQRWSVHRIKGRKGKWVQLHVYLLTDSLAVNRNVIVNKNGETINTSQWQERRLIFGSYSVCHSISTSELDFSFKVNWIINELSFNAFLYC